MARIVSRLRTTGSRPATAAIAFGVFGYVMATTPSLLPRPWYLQGLVAGLSGVAWYAVGSLVDGTWRRFATWADLRIEMAARPRCVMVALWTSLLALALFTWPVLGWLQQREATQQLGMTVPGPLYVVKSGILSFVTIVGSLALWRLLTMAFHRLLARFTRLPDLIGRALAGALVVVAALMVVQYGVIGEVLRIAGDKEDSTANQAPAGVTRPDSSLLSGSSMSREPWDSLGLQGRKFVGRALTAPQIKRVTGGPAKDPIRVYVGKSRYANVQDQADAVVAELDRTNAWSREAVVLFTTTGTGWVNEWNSSAVEYLLGGDCATAAIQHSNLPSVLALIDAPTSTVEAGQAVTDALEARLARIPRAERPKLYVGGESLGAFGGNAAFSSPTELLKQVDGAVWTGTPSFTPLHEAVTKQRTTGSTQAAPVVDNGEHFRFASKPRELVDDQFGRPLGGWAGSRVVYLQHRSDPVVWWSPSLLFRTPDWLNETRQGSTSARMSWLPVVTFWQVSADMAVATNVPSGLGHNYHDEVVSAWSGVLGQYPAADHSNIIDAIRQPAG